jgi:hypothetical protein
MVSVRTHTAKNIARNNVAPGLRCNDDLVLVTGEGRGVYS